MQLQARIKVLQDALDEAAAAASSARPGSADAAAAAGDGAASGAASGASASASAAAGDGAGGKVRKNARGSPLHRALILAHRTKGGGLRSRRVSMTDVTASGEEEEVGVLTLPEGWVEVDSKSRPGQKTPVDVLRNT